ncbi:hypothetical protein [Streptomyces sp. NPDC047928]|uniref:hypothetical protein n=1 Tax=unclassified Streptomyces TaxID=2593676 RepID=UPI00371CC908
MESTPHSTPALGAGWTVTLVIDAVATLLTALVLGGVGLLLPAFAEDYDMSTTRHLSEAAAFFGGSALLVVSLVVTTLLVRGRPGRRRIGLVTATARLGCLVAGAAALVIYGAVTYGF